MSYSRQAIMYPAFAPSTEFVNCATGHSVTEVIVDLVVNNGFEIIFSQIFSYFITNPFKR